LLRRDRKPAVVREHVLVPAELLAVAGWAAEDFAPPRGDMCPMLLVHAAREERRQQLVALDAIVERVDQAPDRVLASRPFKERVHGLSPSSSLTSYLQTPIAWDEHSRE